MYEKYLLSVGDVTVGLKFNIETKVVTIGGFARFRPQMETLIMEYFNLPLPREKIKSNKLRYTFKLKSVKRLREFLLKIEKELVIVEPVKSLGRVMR